MSIPLRRLAWAVLAVGLAFALGCSQNADTPGQQPKAAPLPASSEARPWHMDLQVSPDHPSMVKPMTFTLHITDEHAQPVNAAEVSGALTMKLMDMGATQVKFTPTGNGYYEASMKDMDMSGPWNLAVDASQGPLHAKKSFEFTVGD